MYYGGLKVVLCEWLTEGTTQKRTHKKKRINKKWRRKYGYIGIPSNKSYVMGDTILFHPKTWSIIEKRINGRK
jgi:hypothetical protein